jgi:orotate phosphoribosyltransferase
MDIKAITFRVEPPFIFTSGWRSPVYVNCRKIISHVSTRNSVVELATEELRSRIDISAIDCIAGGETAGIPYAAWISNAFQKPMVYVRKKQKEFGLQEHVVGELPPGSRCLLVEDLNTDGKSKIHFSNVIRSSGGKVKSVFCVFNYGVFPGTEETFQEAGLDLLYLTDWPSTIEAGIRSGYFNLNEAQELREYLRDPVTWSHQQQGPVGQPASIPSPS